MMQNLWVTCGIATCITFTKKHIMHGCIILKQKNPFLASLCDPFGMAKWPFQRLLVTCIRDGSLGHGLNPLVFTTPWRLWVPIVWWPSKYPPAVTINGAAFHQGRQGLSGTAFPPRERRPSFTPPLGPSTSGEISHWGKWRGLNFVNVFLFISFFILQYIVMSFNRCAIDYAHTNGYTNRYHISYIGLFYCKCRCFVFPMPAINLTNL